MFAVLAVARSHRERVAWKWTVAVSAVELMAVAELVLLRLVLPLLVLPRPVLPALARMEVLVAAGGTALAPRRLPVEARLCVLAAGEYLADASTRQKRRKH